MKITKTLWLLVLMVITTGCQKEDDAILIESSEKERNFKVELVNKNDYSNNSILSGILQNIPNQFDFKSQSDTNYSKMTHIDTYDFYIKDEHAYHIMSSDYESYTFEVVRPQENNLLENMVVSIKSDGTYEALLMKYDVNESERQTIIDGNIPDGIEDKTSIETLPDISNSDGSIDPVAIGNTGIYHDFATGTCYIFGGAENPTGTTLIITWVPINCPQSVIDFIANSTNPGGAGGGGTGDDDGGDEDLGPDLGSGNNGNWINPGDYSGGGGNPNTGNNNTNSPGPNDSNTTNENGVTDEIEGATKPLMVADAAMEDCLANNFSYDFCSCLDTISLANFNSLSSDNQNLINDFISNDGCNDTTQNFADDLIGFLSNNPNVEIDFDDTLAEDQTINIASFDELEISLSNPTSSLSEEQNGILKKKKFTFTYLMGMFTHHIRVEIEFTEPDSNSCDCIEINDVETFMFGNTTLAEWEQLGDYWTDESNDGNQLTVYVRGKRKIGVELADFPFRLSYLVTFVVKFDNATGDVIEYYSINEL